MNDIIQKKAHIKAKAKPVLKWAGGKAQLLAELHSLVPRKFNKYIEPFMGGGAMFFSLTPNLAVLADSNLELINLYQVLSTDVEPLINELLKYSNSKDFFYSVRNQDTKKLSRIEKAARTIYLNKTCFNGLYRVNKSGRFNVPFGNYKNPAICRPDDLRAAAIALKGKTLINADYKTVLADYAAEGDLVFLDPPYLPVSQYADFKRYTKEQFYEEDHRELAEEVQRLHEIGCTVILTNSNHPLVHDLYSKFKIEVVSTKRNINCNGSKRVGEDTIVYAPAKKRFDIKAVPDSLDPKVNLYPPTRYMGSKAKLLPYIQDVVKHFEFDTVLDLFSGSAVVSYLFKSLGKDVISNDYMAMNASVAMALIENNTHTLSEEEIDSLFKESTEIDTFVQDTFSGIYFTDEENILIDKVRANAKKLKNKYKRAIALTGLIRACIKKRPRGIFTYIGHRYDDGRTDLKKPLKDHIVDAIEIINAAVFDNDKANKAKRCDAMSVRTKPDLVYMDPPYYSPHSDNEYVRRYHFVEGLACDWQGVEMQWHTQTKKFKNYPTPFSSRVGAEDAFDKLFKKFQDSVLLVSYSSNSLPTKEQLISLMAKYKTHVEVIDIDYKYSFGNQSHKKNDNNNKVKEYLFIGY